MKVGLLDKMIERWDSLSSQELQNLFLKLAEQKGIFKQVFDVMKEGLILFNAKGQVTYANLAAAKTLGQDLEEIKGEGFSKKVFGIAWNELEGHISPVSQDVEITYPEPRFLNLYLMPLKAKESSQTNPKTHPLEPETTGYVLIIRDITHEQAKTEEQLEAEQLSALSLLAASVAHEIGNPLNSLSLHLQLIERQLKKETSPTLSRCQDHLQVAQNELARLDILLKQFLQAIRPTTLHKEPCSLNALIEETLEMLAPEIEQRAITIHQDFDSHLPKIALDKTQFKQVLYNLLKNAYQAIPPNQNGSITLKTWITNQDIFFSLIDTGTGICPEAMGTLFEPFQTTKKNGNGLGLLIVRRIIREHGGTLRVMSEVGIGTEITIQLPTDMGRIRLLPTSF